MSLIGNLQIVFSSNFYHHTCSEIKSNNLKQVLYRYVAILKSTSNILLSTSLPNFSFVFSLSKSVLLENRNPLHQISIFKVVFISIKSHFVISCYEFSISFNLNKKLFFQYFSSLFNTKLFQNILIDFWNIKTCFFL